MKRGLSLSPVNLWLEPLLGAGVAAGLVAVLWHLRVYGYLPQPFFYDAHDTWMDWFNTSIWARDAGMYDSWQTIYPPLSFVFLRIFGVDSCLAQHGIANGTEVRYCDWIGVLTFHLWFVLNILLVSRIYLKNDRSTALPRAIAVAAGLPALSGLDRGNLIIMTFTCMMIAYTPLVRSARLRWLAAGLAINFKVYLIGALVPQLLRRRWLWFEGALLATVGVYILTLGILGDGTPGRILYDIQFFSDASAAGNITDIWNASTYTPFLSLLASDAIPVSSIIGSHLVGVAEFVMPLMLHVAQATILMAAAAIWYRPHLVPMYRPTNLGLSFALITSEAGAYTQVLILFFTMLESWKGIGRKWSILTCYVLAIPADLVIFEIPPSVRESFLSQRPVFVEYAFAWGQILRPGLVMSIPFALACVTIRATWLDIRANGWGLRRGAAPRAQGGASLPHPA